MKISVFFNLPTVSEMPDETKVWALELRTDDMPEPTLSQEAYTDRVELSQHWWFKHFGSRSLKILSMTLREFIDRSDNGMNPFWTLGKIKNIKRRYEK